jgi:hypothetical protein
MVSSSADWFCCEFGRSEFASWSATRFIQIVMTINGHKNAPNTGSVSGGGALCSGVRRTPIMNAAELATVVTILGSSATAGLVAASDQAGWFTPLFVVGGLGLGIAAGAGVHKLAYWFLHADWEKSGAVVGWALLFAYTLIPMTLGFAAMAVVGGLTHLILKHGL